MSYTLLGPCDFRVATVPALIHVFFTPMALTLVPRSAVVAREAQGCPVLSELKPAWQLYLTYRLVSVPALFGRAAPPRPWSTQK